MRKPRIFLADDHAMLLDAFRRMLEQEFEVVGTAADGLELLECAPKLRPDLVVIDLGLPLLSGVDAGRELEVFLSRFSRDRVVRGDTVFDIEICRFADVPHDLITSVALGHTAGQCRHGGDVSSVSFLLKDHRIAHRVWP